MFINRNYLRTRSRNRQRKKFFPGHYIYVGTAEVQGLSEIGSSRDLISRQLVLNDPNFVGYHATYTWSHLEPSRGVYNFSKILQDLEIAQNDGKVLSVFIYERTWSPDVPFPGPSYMNPDSSDYDSDYADMYFSPVDNPYRKKPNLWKPIFGDRMVELITAMAAAIDEHPALAVVALPETANVGMPDQPGFTGAQYLRYLKRVNTAAAVAFKNTLFHQTTNWFEGMTEAQGKEFTEHLIEVCKGSFGATDSIAITDGIKPALENAFGEYFIEYRDIAPIFTRIESPSYQYGTAQIQFDYAVDAIGSNMVGWQVANNWVPGELFTIFDAIAVVDAENGRVNPNIPSNLLT
jgi:hypothetical protein